MRLAVALLVAAVVAALDVDLVAKGGDGVEVDTLNEAPVTIRRSNEPPALVTAFTARGGKAAPLETTTLLIDGVNAARVVRFDGELAGSNAELTLVFASLPRALRRWIRGFFNGKFKKPEISLVTKTPGTNVPGKPLTFSRYDYKGVLIRELMFPSIGEENGVFKLRVLYQSHERKDKVEPHSASETPIRSQFFKLRFSHPDSKAKDPAGPVLSQSVYRIDSFSVSRGGGFGKQDPTTLTVHFAPHSTLSSGKSKKITALTRWTEWYTQHKSPSGFEPPKSRNAQLKLFVWTGSSMERHAGEAAVGQLKPLLALNLTDITVKSLDSGEAKVVLNVDDIAMVKESDLK